MRKNDIEIFELDLPELLEDKAKRIEACDIQSASTAVPCNLASPDWMEKLVRAGFRPDERSFGSLLGISYYLSKEEFAGLLKGIRSVMAEGSSICFDYPTEDESCEAETNRTLAKGAGEEMKARYTEEELTLLLQECGFLIYEHLNAKEMTESCFLKYNEANSTNRMMAPEGVAYVLATAKI